MPSLSILRALIFLCGLLLEPSINCSMLIFSSKDSSIKKKSCSSDFKKNIDSCQNKPLTMIELVFFSQDLMLRIVLASSH